VTVLTLAEVPDHPLVGLPALLLVADAAAGHHVQHRVVSPKQLQESYGRWPRMAPGSSSTGCPTSRSPDPGSRAPWQAARMPQRYPECVGNALV